jgi:hypothetical protein
MEIDNDNYYYIVYDSYIQGNDCQNIKNINFSMKDAEKLIDKLHREDIKLEILRIKINIMEIMDNEERNKLNYRLMLLQTQIKESHYILHYQVEDKIICRYKMYCFKNNI